MTRLNLILLLAAIVCAVGTITAQHRARNLFVALEKEQALARHLDEDFGNLRIEQGTWARRARIEGVAASHLQMQVPAPNRILVVPGDGIERKRP
ncbi:MAG: cell division protein FtsL [Burkholderiales bacterium]